MTLNNYLSCPSCIFKRSEMAEDNKDGRTKRYLMMRSIMDFGMGFFYIIIAVILLFADRFGLYLAFPPKPFSYIFAGLCILYGGFRIYRGIQKNYFN